MISQSIRQLCALSLLCGAALSILPEDLEYTPFDSKGGLGGFYRVFGEKYQEILDEMNEELVA